MKRIVLVILSIMLVSMVTACSSQECTCACCTTQEGCGAVSKTGEITVPNEEVENLEDSCENPIGYSHYPYVKIYPNRGNVGTVLLTTAEHGSCFDGFFNGFGTYTGTGIIGSRKCYSTSEKATTNFIEIDSRGHEIIITMSYNQNVESFTLKSGDKKLLSIRKSSASSSKAYVYVIVT